MQERFALVPPLSSGLVAARSYHRLRVRIATYIVNGINGRLSNLLARLSR